MNAKELRTKSADELKEFIRAQQARVQELRFSLGQKKTKNVKEIGAVKKGIACALTILQQIR